MRKATHGAARARSGASRARAAWIGGALATAALCLSACGGPIDPNRPPLPRDYEPPPLESGPQSRPLDRI
ncbi:MAG: hypothetical protein AAGM38_11080 [Pseudomonadota bacterium]